MSEGEPGFRDVLRIPGILPAMLGTFTIMLGFGIVSPVLPNYAKSFGVADDAVGLLVSGFSFARLIADPFVGRFVDRYGERGMTTLGAAIVGVTSIAAGFARTFPTLLLFRSAGGFGSAIFFAGLLSYLLRTIPQDRSGRVMSVYYGSFNVGFIAGGPIGGYIAEWFGLRTPLFVYGSICFVSAWTFWRTMHDTRRAAKEERRGGLRRLPWSRPLVAALVTNGAYLWMVGAVYSTLIPLFAREDLKLAYSGIGLALAIATGTELVSLFPAGKATDRRGRRAVLIPSFAAFGVMSAVIGIVPGTLVFMAAMALLGVTSGFAGVPPAPMLSDVTPIELKATGVAAFRLVGDIGFVLGPLTAGWTAKHFGFGAAFAVSALPAFVALALVLSISETMPMLPKTGEAAGL